MKNRGKSYSRHRAMRTKQPKSRLENVENAPNSDDARFTVPNVKAQPRDDALHATAQSQITTLDDTWYRILQDVSIDFSVER